jgi:hypothetical protein
VDEQRQRSGRRRSREEADRLAAEYEASGLSRQEFCDQRDVPLKTLARYLVRFRREKNGHDGAPEWVAVEVATRGGSTGELVVVLDGGRRIEVRRGFDVDTFRRLLAELERA